MLWLAPEEAPKTQRGYKVKNLLGVGELRKPSALLRPPD